MTLALFVYQIFPELKKHFKLWIPLEIVLFPLGNWSVINQINIFVYQIVR